MHIKTTFKGKTDEYTMVSVSRKEAFDLIISLTNQLSTHSPNKGRLESMVHGDLNGYFSICVEEDDYCIQCGAFIEETKGKLEKGGLICDHHKTHKELGNEFF